MHVLEERALLAPGAAVIADNVLKPGAPRFLWKLRSKWRNGEIYHLQILSLQVAGVFFCLDLGKLVVYRSKPKNKLPSVGNLLTLMVEFFLGRVGGNWNCELPGITYSSDLFCVRVGCFSMVTRRVLTTSWAFSGKT